MRRRPFTSALLVALLLAMTACGAAGDDPGDSGGTPTAPGSGGVAPSPVLVVVEGEPGNAGISVAEALGHQPTDDIVAVTGALFAAADGSVVLCDAIAESFPPQCAGARIAVEGLDLDSLRLEEANGVRWAEGVTLLGSVE